MKCLIVLSALAAFASAGLVSPIAYSGLPLAYGSLGYAGAPLLSSYYAGAHAPLISSYSTFAAPSVVASPAVLPAPAVVSAPAVVAAPTVVATPVAGVKTQYHAQDELGQASYGHSEPLQAHSAVQDAAGNKVGSFSYVAPDGRVLRTDYVADGLGYRVNSNALPIGPGAGPAAVVDTPEVVAARAAHLAAHARARRSLVAVGHTPAATAPLATPLIAAPLAYSAHHVASPFAYSTHVAAPIAPLAYSTHLSAPIASPLAYSAIAPAVLSREATLTTVVNNPGHAVSYRVD